jgi:primosomal protein N' (replication factor Y)
VLLQTYHPDHPAIAQLCTQGYEALAIQGLYERQQLALPPFSHQVIIRAESATETLALALLEQLRFFADAQIQADARFNQIGIVGPYAAIIVRKAGQHRYLLSLKCGQRAPLHALMAQLTFWLEQNTHNHKVRFAIDVDPLETY